MYLGHSDMYSRFASYSFKTYTFFYCEFKTLFCDTFDINLIILFTVKKCLNLKGVKLKVYYYLF